MRANVGFNTDSTIAPGKTYTYIWYAGDRKFDSKGKFVAAPIEFGATNLRDIGDVIKHSSHGACSPAHHRAAGLDLDYRRQQQSNR